MLNIVQNNIYYTEISANKQNKKQNKRDTILMEKVMVQYNNIVLMHNSEVT